MAVMEFLDNHKRLPLWTRIIFRLMSAIGL